jgi:hypothetical protein
MSEKKIVVPEGMHRAAVERLLLYEYCKVDAFEPSSSTPEQQASGRASVALEAALHWLSENPLIPTDDFVEEVIREHSRTNVKWACSDWQRRMFLAPAPEVPEEIKDLLEVWNGAKYERVMQNSILDAYRRGQESKTAA